jgi:TorA maturation chaperone TorD
MENKTTKEPVANREQVLLAQNRAGTWRLLARFFESEIDLDIFVFLLEQRHPFPLPAPEQRDTWLQKMREEFARLFVLNVYPYESIYTGADVMLNTAETEEVATFYRHAGFNPPSGLYPDHLAAELSFLAWLCEEEAQAYRENSTFANFCRATAAAFLEHHLLPWLPLFTNSLRRNLPEPFYEALVAETMAFACEDYAYLRENISPEIAPLPSEIPAEKTLNWLVRHLITPARCGFFLSKLEIFRLSRELQLPLGMVDRFTALKNLLNSAGQYSQLPLLFEKLLDCTRDCLLDCTRLESSYPTLVPLWANRRSRLEETRVLLEETRNLPELTAPPEEIY